jgi:plasmid stabilization system protein ParE
MEASWIKSANPSAAQQWLERIRRSLGRIADFPQLGTARREVDPELRMLPSGKHVILYRIDKARDAVVIVRVLRGERDWMEAFND